MATQTCDRTVTGRNFDYASALSVIQEEDYLEDEDFDDIRLIRKQGEVIQAIENFEEKISDHEDSELLGTFEEHHHREKRFLFQNTSSFDFCMNCTDSSPTVPGVVSTILAVSVAILALNPPPGNVPTNSPQPGSPGGGGPPSVNPGNILALVPAGLIAVATFPPFGTTRTVPAQAVIWKEPSGTAAGTPLRKKRSSGYSPQPSFLDRFFKNVRCLGPRLTARFGRKPAPVDDYGYHGKKKRDTGYGYHSYDVHEECGTTEDCFDLPCPRYGFAVRYTFTSGDGGYGQSYGITERQTGEGFRSAAPPDCRTTG